MSASGLRTTHKCVRIAAFGDACVYENICYDPASAFWFQFDPDANLNKRSPDPVTYGITDFKTGVVYPRSTIPAPDPSKETSPYNGGSECKQYLVYFCT